MVIDRNTVISLIKEHEHFLVLSHEHPDGDTLGCAFGLCEILKIMGKKRAFRCADAVSKDFCFLTEDFRNDEVENPFIIAVDIADEKLLGSLKEEFSGKIDLCIDHHMSNSGYGKMNYVEDRAAACEIIYDIWAELDIPQSRYFRNCIYTGISTDTGCFRYQNTTAKTLRIAANLMEDGIDSTLINKLMFETKSRALLALELLARKTLEYHFDGKCAIITLTQNMYKLSGSNEQECHAIYALPRQIEGVLVGVILKEKEDGTYGISLRTEGGIDASLICGQMGGGGHKGAAGASFDIPYDEGKARLLKIIGSALGEE